eukprot:SAG11_NODE_868_length_6814_cov_13.161430_4_plen_115_part_00
MPGADPTGLFSFCRKSGTVPQAYSPLGNYATHSLIHSNFTNAIGAKMRPPKSGVSVALRWVAQHNVPMCVAADVLAYLKEDEAIYDGWSLSAADMAALDDWSGALEDPTRGACH